VNDFGEVTLDWKTANELDNAGFEVERRAIDRSSDNKWQMIASYNDVASLRGNGRSNTPKYYSFIDQPLPGSYEYRIADVALDGTRTAHDAKRVEIGFGVASAWSVGSAFPNPAVNTLKIPFSLPASSEVVLTMKNILGQSVFETSQNFNGGNNLYEIELPELGNGSYLYQLTAIVEGQTVWVSPASSIVLQK
jgi:hypothetical protein